MSLFEIKNRFTESVIFRLECGSLKLCVEAAVKSRVNLTGANLTGVNLSGVDLTGVDLTCANLSRANLSRANLSRANLSGASYGQGVPLEHEPLQLSGLEYHIIIMDTHIKIGCRLHSYDEWSNFTDEQITAMASGALDWWNEWRSFVLSLSLGHQQLIATKKEAS